MKLKIKCTLKLDITEIPIIDIAEDINIIELPDNISDADFVKAFDHLRAAVKKQHLDTILSLFSVELHEIKA